jgi:hypothetical protein
MGQGIGFSYLINPTSLAPHSYRLCLSVGVQPEHAHSLLGPQAISGGTAGRFLWAPATSLIVEECPTWRLSDPIRLVAQLPGDIATPLQTDGGPPYVPTTLEYLPQGRPRPVVIEVCQEAEDAVRTGALQRLRGLGDPMEGYDLLMQEKVGSALAVLDGRREVALEDWLRAEHVLDVSRATRMWVLSRLGGAAQHGADTQAIIAGRAQRNALRDDPVWQRCVAAVLRHLKSRPMQEWELSQTISPYQRPHLGSVLIHLVPCGSKAE